MNDYMALTLKQPWAYCVTDLGKRSENRTWEPPMSLIGKRFAIHAGKGIDMNEWAAAGRIWPDLRKKPMLEVAYGAIVATCLLGGFVVTDRAGTVLKRAGLASKVYEPEPDRWAAPGSVIWLLQEVEVMPEPIVCRGAQRLWVVPRGILPQVA